MNPIQSLMLADLNAGGVPDGLDRLVAEINRRHPHGVIAVLMYGSCRRKLDAAEGLVDLLVVVDAYPRFYPRRLLALLNHLLPPNVFYLETEGPARLRCKYAVISLDQFERRVRSRADHYFWARFCQPMRALSGRPEVLARLAAARAEAARSFARRIAPLAETGLAATDFWIRGLAMSYRCELRPEPPDNARRLIHHDPDYWQALTTLLADEGSLKPEQAPSPWALRLGWRLRRVGGKLTNLARLFKATATFTDGIDYIVWKVERHSGVRIEPTDRMRRHPRLAAWGLAWRMWRQGGFR